MHDRSVVDRGPMEVHFGAMAGTRTRIVVDDSALASRIGGRIRAARLAAGLTQQQLAAGRYTKAYISALEKGHAKPSMAALDFIAGRLGMPASRFLSEDTRWSRIEADLLLAAGRWSEAVEAYADQLELRPDRAGRADALLGRVEALCRLDRGREAVGPAVEAVELLGALGRDSDAMLAGYWLAYANFQAGNAIEARSLLLRTARPVPPVGRHGWAPTCGCGCSWRSAGWPRTWRTTRPRSRISRRPAPSARTSMTAAGRRCCRCWPRAVPRPVTWRAPSAPVSTAWPCTARCEARLEAALLENNLAIAYLRVGNLARASEYAAGARRAARGGSTTTARWRTCSRPRPRSRSPAATRRARCRLAREALEHAAASDDQRAGSSSLLTIARAHAAAGDTDDALEGYARTVDALRRTGPVPRLRQALTDWADLLARLGRHREAFDLTREALQSATPVAGLTPTPPTLVR